MRRELSAGGVLVRRLRGRWMLAAIRPGGKPAGVWALPKGLIGPGEDPAAAALREVEEETGAHGRLERRLGDVRYVYTWSGERVFKMVSFYLVRYSGGRLGDPDTAAFSIIRRFEAGTARHDRRRRGAATSVPFTE